MDSNISAKSMNITAWLLSFSVSVLAILVWAQAFTGEVSVNNYSLFPLFGLLAFSLMWAHYVVGGLRRYFAVDKVHLKMYYKITSAVVLFAILLHPGLFVYQLWNDGRGLPPESYKYYVAQSAIWSVLIGTIALWIFLMFETKKIFGKQAWWKFVEYAQVVAMVLIYVHAFKLGGEIQTEWYKIAWVFYGLSFLLASSYILIRDKRESK